MVQQRRDQAGHRLPEGVGEPGALAGRLGAQGQRPHRAEAGRPAVDPDEDLRQPQPAGDRRLLRAVHLRLPAPAHGAGDEGDAGRAAALAAHRRADGEDRLGPELGGDPRRRVRQALGRRQLRRHPEGHLRPVREHLHDVPAAAVRALPQPGVRRELPVGLDLQARGGRHRPHRPEQVPRLAHVRVRLPVQEDLLQLVVGQGGEVHLLLSAHRGGPADGVLGDLRRPHPLPRRAAVRRRPHRGGGERRESAGPVPGAARRCSSIRTIRR